MDMENPPEITMDFACGFDNQPEALTQSFSNSIPRTLHSVFQPIKIHENNYNILPISSNHVIISIAVRSFFIFTVYNYYHLVI